jgi:abortive infection bacteriophage resistance protein
MTTYKKPPLTISQQIEKLEQRGLTVSNHQQTQQCLTNVGFYRLSAYFIPYEEPHPDKRNHQLQDGTEFDDIFKLYTFDQRLRLLVMEAIERIEVAVRTQWANEMSLNHGRLWNRSFTKKRPLIKKLRGQLIITLPVHKDGKTQSHVKENIYNYLIVICHIMKKIQPDNHWQQRLASHIDTATTSQQLRMGFVSQWQQKQPWQDD